MKLKKWIRASREFISPTPPILILMYHRVIDVAIDPWNLAVSPSNFEQQLKVLKSSGLLVSLSQISEIIYGNEKMKPSIALTFDDGYMDNFLNAKPLLESFLAPTTFFITSKNIGQQKSFWWDELAELILEKPILPQFLSIKLEKSASFYFDLKEEKVLTEELNLVHKAWNATLTPPSLRSQLYIALWQILGPMDYEDQQAIMDKLRNWAGLTTSGKNGHNFSMTGEQLQLLSESPLFAIGAHTLTHPVLSGLPRERIRNEISENKLFLESNLNLSVDSLAYPSGKFNEMVKEELKDMGFKMAFTTNPKPVVKKTDPLQIGRFQVNNWSGPEFKEILATWLG
jgi:peptidoglycan/xylan/chitin deacetylase (PgdA/CDA1 family)